MLAYKAPVCQKTSVAQIWTKTDNNYSLHFSLRVSKAPFLRYKTSKTTGYHMHYAAMPKISSVYDHYQCPTSNKVQGT